MTPQQALDEVGEKFKTEWGAETAVAWEDLDFDPAAVNEYVRFSMQHAAGDRADIAGDDTDPLFRRTGLVFVQVFTPKNSSTDRSNALVAKALRFLERYRGQVWMRNQSPIPVGREGRWRQVNVSAEFIYDSISAP